MSREVPSIMYHTIGVPKPDWVWHHLTTPYELFDEQMGYLSRKGYSTLTTTEFLECHRTGSFPPKALYLTFDDGYLDNWVFAAPILQKYGFCGTIFVNPEFVDPSSGCRPQLGDALVNELHVHGFLNWDEMREMEQIGVMEMQSHAMTHTWYFSGPTLVDFRHPGDQYVWMDWNEKPEMKWAYLGDDAFTGAMGAPVYEHQKSLSGPRFFPSEEVTAGLVRFCEEQGQNFFDNPDWRSRLEEHHATLVKAHGAGVLESDDDYIARVQWELSESQRVLEEQLDKRVEVFCWPGGGNSEEAFGIASSLYAASTVASTQRERAGFDENGFFRITRVGAPIMERDGRVIYMGGMYTDLFLQEYQGSRLARFKRQVLKALYMAKQKAMG